MRVEVGAPTHSHWMLREIREQPATLAATFHNYVDSERFDVDRCRAVFEWLARVNTKIVIAASGSSRHAGMVGELLLKDISGIPVNVEYASEYSYQAEEPDGQDAVLLISQSGETADTLAALRKAAAAGLDTLAITNVPESTMSLEATVALSTMAGRERAIPATKSFTAQLLTVYLLALMAAEVRGTMDSAELQVRLAEIEALSGSIAAQLAAWEAAMSTIAEAHESATSFLFLGRGIHYPIAREGALKLKESAYLHAEGYPSGELKHGPNALVADGTPLVMIATVDRSSADSVQRYDKVLRLMRDMRQQGAAIIAVANTGDREVARLADSVVFIDETREILMAICEVIPLQLFAYRVAVNHGIDVDNPRNLTKAVLEE